MYLRFEIRGRVTGDLSQLEGNSKNIGLILEQDPQDDDLRGAVPHMVCSCCGYCRSKQYHGLYALCKITFLKLFAP